MTEQNPADTPTQIRVLIVDANAERRVGLREFLEEHDEFIVVGGASTVKEGVAGATSLMPDVTLASCDLPGQGVAGLVDELFAVLPETAVVAYGERRVAAGMRKTLTLAGVKGVLETEEAHEELPGLIRRVNLLNPRRLAAPVVVPDPPPLPEPAFNPEPAPVVERPPVPDPPPSRADVETRVQATRVEDLWPQTAIDTQVEIPVEATPAVSEPAVVSDAHEAPAAGDVSAEAIPAAAESPLTEPSAAKPPVPKEERRRGVLAGLFGGGKKKPSAASEILARADAGPIAAPEVPLPIVTEAMDGYAAPMPSAPAVAYGASGDARATRKSRSELEQELRADDAPAETPPPEAGDPTPGGPGEEDQPAAEAPVLTSEESVVKEAAEPEVKADEPETGEVATVLTVEAPSLPGEALTMTRAAVAEPELEPQAVPPPVGDDPGAPAAVPETRGKVVAIYSGKGGVGRTMLTVNVAAAMAAEQGKRVAILDLDLQFGDVLSMAEGETETRGTMSDLVARSISEWDDDFVYDIMATGPGGVKILGAPTRPELADVVNADHVTRILRALRERFDYIVVDCGRFLGEPSVAAMDVADKLVIITSATLQSLKNLDATVKICDTLHMAPDRRLFVLNRIDEHEEMTAAHIESHLNCKLSAIIPRDNKTVVKASGSGRPFVIEKPTAPISHAVRTLVAEITDAPAPKVQKRGLRIQGLASLL